MEEVAAAINIFIYTMDQMCNVKGLVPYGQTHSSPYFVSMTCNFMLGSVSPLSSAPFLAAAISCFQQKAVMNLLYAACLVNAQQLAAKEPDIWWWWQRHRAEMIVNSGHLSGGQKQNWTRDLGDCLL